MIRTAVLTLLFGLIRCDLLFAQQVSGEAFLAKMVLDEKNERVYLQTNATILFSGETLLLKADCRQWDGEPTQLSKVLYVDAVDEAGQLVLQTKLPIENGHAAGDIFLSSSLITGNYTVVAYTNWMRNFSYRYFALAPLTIINPFKKNTPASKTFSSEKMPIKIQPSLGISLKLSNTTLKPRSALTVEVVGLANQNEDVSVSVRHIDTEALQLLPPVHWPNFEATQTQSGHFRYLPELRGSLISGTVVSENGSAAVSKKVYAVVPDRQFFFSSTNTNATGKFHIYADALKADVEMVLLANPNECANCQLHLDGTQLNDYSVFIPSPLKLDTTLRKWIEKKSALVQVENAFFEVKQDTTLQERMPGRFYGKPDRVYRLDDYVRFPTMEDIFVEYISEVVLKKKSGKALLRVMDVRKRSAFEKPPLVLIDGVPIFDHQTVMNYNPLWVERVEVVGKHYYYGALEVWGVISICTYDGDAKNLPIPNRNRVAGVQPIKKYFSPNYQSSPASYSRIPDYRHQLYWNPSFKVSNTGKFTFYTSDLEGECEIKLKWTDAQGNSHMATEVFRVVK